MKKFLIGFFTTGLILIALSTGIRTFGQTSLRPASFGAGIQGLNKEAGNKEALMTEDGKSPLLKIVEVLPNSTAEALGIKAGDYIVSINGEKFETVQDFGEFLQTKKEGDSVEIVLLSKGERVTKKGVFKSKASSSAIQVPQSSGLPRKGWFGIGASPAKNNNAAQEGLAVMVVMPNSTGEALGIKVGDIILAIDGKPMNDADSFVSYAQSKTEGDSIEFTILSNGVKSVKKGVVKSRPKEVSENADVIYDVTEMSLGKLRTITYRPKNKTGKLPAVFYIQGLPCQSQELPDAKDPRRQAYEDWVKAGFVVFRVERPNLGDSVTTKDCRDIDFNEEVETNKAGYKKLLSYDFVDNDNIFFFGHSMGGWTAPFIAEMKQPKGIIVYGTGIVSWFEYFIHLFRIQSTYGGGTHVAAEAETRKMIPLLYEWLEAGKTAEEMRKNPALKPIVDEPGMFEGEYFQGKAAGRSAHYFHTMSKQNLAEAWSKVNCKVLAIYAEFDVQALNGRDAEIIAETVNQSKPGNGEYLMLPKTEHIFAKVDSYKQVAELYSKPNFIQFLKDNYNPEVGRTTNEWMKKAMAK